MTGRIISCASHFQAIFVPADDLTDPAPATTFAHLDATTVLSRGISELGIYPAVDPLDSSSRIMDPNVVGQEHYNVARGVQKILQVSKSFLQLLHIYCAASLLDKRCNSFPMVVLFINFRITNHYKISSPFWVWMSYLKTISSLFREREKLRSSCRNHSKLPRSSPDILASLFLSRWAFFVKNMVAVV